MGPLGRASLSVVNRRLVQAAVVAGLLSPGAASAQASLAGRTLDEIERPVPGLQVTAWTRDADGKSRRLAGEALSDDDGAWRIEPLDTGRYQVHVRMPDGMEGNWADRWYDQEDPFASGWVGADADWIELADNVQVEGLDLLMLLLGGFQGRVMAAAAPLAGVRVQARATEDCRRKHSDETDTGANSDGYRLGRYSFRGMVPGVTRLIAWHPSGELQTAAFDLPFEIVAEESPDLDDFELAALPDDPHEPNDDPAQVGAGSPDAGALAAVPPQPWRTAAGTRIGPRGAGDRDWYCLYADDGDRFIATATARLPEGFDPPCEEHPWIDPMVSMWRLDPDDAEPLLLVANDDADPGRRSARADTGLLAEGGRICALVSTYGDSAWDGIGRQSWGEYELELRMGNRPPQIDLLDRGQPVADVIEVREGDAVCLDVRAEDPDGDALALTVELRDKTDERVEEARFVPDGAAPAHAPAGRWCWTAGATAADRGPFILDAVARDAEFGAKVAVRIEAQAINLPPTVPVLVSPVDGARLDESVASLVIDNSTDGDGDPLKYHFEVHVGGVAGVPEHAASVPENPDADATSWRTPDLPDEARICWRARADDGRRGGLSDWSEAWCFLVDAVNAPPETPRWNKPSGDDLIYVARPTLSVWSTTDPEGDPVQIEFALAGDDAFGEGTHTGRAPQDPRSPTVAWRADQDLAWGQQYFARARAHDSRGGVSAWTPTQHLRLKPNRAPTPARLLSPELDAACDATRLTGGLPDPIVLKSPYDPEGHAVVVQVQIFETGRSSDPVLDAEQPIPLTATGNGGPADPSDGDVSVATTGVTLEEGRRYILRIRTGDAELFGGWSECEFWIDRLTAQPTDLRITRPAEGERVSGPARVRALLEHSGWPDAEIAGRRMEATWRLCGGPTPASPANADTAGDCTQSELPIAFDGTQASLDVGFLDLGYWRLEACARSVSDPADQCAATASAEFLVVHDGSPDSSCDCAIAAPRRGPFDGAGGGPGPWWILAVLAAAMALTPRRRRRP